MLTSRDDAVFDETCIGDQSYAYLSNLSLDNIRNKLVTRIGWTPADAEKIVELYRNYLFLKKKYGKTHKLPPSEEMDDVWHHHILDTENYKRDCEIIFGEYLHHYPYFGIDDKSNMDDLNGAFEETQALHKKEFGKEIIMVKGLRSRFRIAWKEFTR